ARAYLAVAEGEVGAMRIESNIAADRGDGIRGSTRHADQGQHAVTFVEPIRRLRKATLCRVRPATGSVRQSRTTPTRMPLGSCCTRRSSASNTRSPARSWSGTPRRPRTSWRSTRRWEARVATSDGTIRSALAAIVEAIRSGYGPNKQHVQDGPDGGYDPAFVERTAPLLEFLWS